MTQTLLVARERVDLHRRVGRAGPVIAAPHPVRRRAELHKRLIIFAPLPLVFESMLHLGGTLVDRVPLSRGTLLNGTLLIVLAIHFLPAVHDRLTRRRIHPASIWIPVLMIVWSVVLNDVVAPSTLAFTVGSWLLK